ncbi:MAG: type II toxin-antitoxin system VapC family toxin [Candidatus Nitrosocaldus sp.]|nr:type II toxin-antitoxin system VapC family toxin [Candidatus Nitrosocaldus sp.]MDW8275453.1 type II toxin-antitoxin system VapC family toxin [Candidatus Nitrosocaldus sp.]
MRRYFDVNVFVYYLIADKKFGEIAKRWLKESEEVLTAQITVFELYVILQELTNAEESDLVKNIIGAMEALAVEFIPIDDWSKVIDVMKRYGLDFEDSIHVYSAISANVDEIISNDDELKKKVNARF